MAVLGVAEVAAWEVVGGGDGAVVEVAVSEVVGGVDVAVAVWEVVGGSEVTRPLSLPVFTDVVVIPGHVKREGRGGSYSKRTAESKRFKEIRSWKRSWKLRVCPLVISKPLSTSAGFDWGRVG